MLKSPQCTFEQFLISELTLSAAIRKKYGNELFPYGFWVLKDGSYFPVQPFGHSRCAYEIVSNTPEYAEQFKRSQENEQIITPEQLIYLDGAIRINSVGRDGYHKKALMWMSLSNTINKDQINTLKELKQWYGSQHPGEQIHIMQEQE